MSDIQDLLALGKEMHRLGQACDEKDKRIAVLEGRLAHSIELTDVEMQSNHSRVKWAEDLIKQLPEGHDGRNSWLLNYGKRDGEG